MVANDPLTPPHGGSLTLLSWNVRGLRTNLKRGKVFSHLKSLSGDIIFMQETHIKHNEQWRLRCAWISQIYQSTFSSKARGVAILIRKNVPFEHISTISDPNGRYLIVSVRILSRHVTFLNIYAPNFDDPGFFRKVFNLIPDLSSTHLIAGGDFNTILDCFLDRLSTRPTSPSNASIALNNIVKSMNLVDIWRLQHPNDKDFSFFSNVHKSYTRIDYFLTDAILTSDVISSKYHDIVISNHSPVELKINIGRTKAAFNWRFNPLLLNNIQFRQQTANKITEYFDQNDTSDVNDSTLWEAFKAVTRGNIIAHESKIKKDKEKELADITAQLKPLEKDYRATASPTKLNEIIKLKSKYNAVLSDRVSLMLLKVKQKHFELADKPDKLLARQLKNIQASRTIHKIKTKTGTTTTDPEKINECFREFYEDLYTSKSSTATSHISEFLRTLHLPKLSPSAQTDLNTDITLEEVKQAIRSFPNGKAAGPDGFGIEFYKAYLDIIAPFMLRMFNHSISVGLLPETLYSANISLILKKGKNQTDPSSYRPIALLGCDLKVFTKILANRLNKCIADIIHEDQTGFIPGRFSFFNVRRLLNIMYTKFSKNSKIAVLALDAQKAFDQVEWSYLLSAIKEFGLGENFASWVKMLYARPTASVITNNNRSPAFTLQRSCRQGCPLSPLLFAVAMEPLAISIRNHPSIAPLILGGVDHRISLYADDVVLFLSRPEVSLPPLLGLIEKFGEISGYTVNWDKSEFLPLTGDLDPHFLKNLSFKIVYDKIKYLGVTIPKDPKLIYKLNFLDMIDKLKSNIESWRLLPLSLIGRVNAIKMVTLPRFLYLFQNLPIFLPKSFFKLIDSLILPFVWGFKVHRISKKHLTKPKSAGGLSLPNFCHYYWAANCRVLMYWQNPRQGNVNASIPSWLAIEQSLPISSLPALLFSSAQPPKSNPGNNFVVTSSLKIWYQIRKSFNLPETSTSTPLYRNHSFPPSLSDNVFLLWVNKGITTIEDLYLNKTFATFTQLKEKFTLSDAHFFRYLQVRDFVRKNISHFQSLPAPIELYTLLNRSPDSKRLTSRFVDLFNLLNPTSSHHLKEAWEKDLALSISDSDWETYLGDIRSCSINSRHQLIQFKVIHRLHYSCVKLHSFYPSISPICSKCKSAEGTLGHLFWFCPKLNQFWSDIFKCFSEVYNCNISPDPLTAILGGSRHLSMLTNLHRKTIQYGMVIAKRNILSHWKSDEAPSFKAWLSEITNLLHMERIRHNVSLSSATFDRMWQPFLLHLSRLT